MKKVIFLILVGLLILPATSIMAQDGSEGMDDTLPVNNWCNWPEDAPKKSPCLTPHDWEAGWVLGYIEQYAADKNATCHWWRGKFPEFDCDAWFPKYSNWCGDFTDNSPYDGWPMDDACYTIMTCLNANGVPDYSFGVFECLPQWSAPWWWLP